jgi:hypothetical protein
MAMRSRQENRRDIALWLALAGAVFGPLAASQLILNNIIPCVFLDLSQVTTGFGMQWKDCSFRVAAIIYEQLYKFGAFATIETVLILFGVVVGIGIIARSNAAAEVKAIVVVMLIVLGLLISSTPFSNISPHSCVSAPLIDQTLAAIPDDDIFKARCVTDKNDPRSKINTVIGSTSHSLKAAFTVIYRMALISGLIGAAAIGIVLCHLQNADLTKLGGAETATATAFQTSTYLMLGISALFAMGMIVVQTYYDVGLQALSFYGEADAGNTPPPFIGAYKAYEDAIQLHWGGTGSIVLASLFLVTLCAIALVRVRHQLSPIPDSKQAWTVGFNLLSIGAPILVGGLQAVAKGFV